MSVTPDNPVTVAPPPETRPPKVRTKPGASLFEPAIVRRAIRDSFVKLDPRQQARNPVMFVVLVGSVWTTVLFFRDLPHAKASDSVFVGLVAIWLWFTVLFADFAEAVAEGRGKAQADTLRKTRSETVARVRQADGTTLEVPSTQLQRGDLCVVLPG
ncbi:MAG TPA: potassium-transporting ATPase subunit B, partial [Acidimicrobiales bacterium]|nr:potassium-transporting ATPase subunit B [Acidimicrobiales bacterium]